MENQPEVENQPEIGLRRFEIDYRKGRRTSRFHIWSPVIKFEQQLNDGEILELCRSAYEQMDSSYSHSPRGE
jgi:hypothetical protein